QVGRLDDPPGRTAAGVGGETVPAAAEAGVCDGRPIGLVEAAGGLERLAVNIHDDVAVVADVDDLQRNGEELVADAQKAAERQGRVAHLAGFRIDREVLHATDVLVA